MGFELTQAPANKTDDARRFEGNLKLQFISLNMKFHGFTVLSLDPRRHFPCLDVTSLLSFDFPRITGEDTS